MWLYHLENYGVSFGALGMAIAIHHITKQLSFELQQLPGRNNGQKNRNQEVSKPKTL
jgi:hypothetical protein